MQSTMATVSRCASNEISSIVSRCLFVLAFDLIYDLLLLHQVSDHSPVIAGFVFQAKAKRRDAAAAAAAPAAAAASAASAASAAGGSDAIASSLENSSSGSGVAPEPPSEPPLEAAAATAVVDNASADAGGSRSSTSSSTSARGPSHPPPAHSPARVSAAVRLESLELMVGTEVATPAGLKILFPMPWEAQSSPHAKARAEVTVESEIAVARRVHMEGMNAGVSGSRNLSSGGTGGAGAGAVSTGGAAASVDSKTGGAKASSSSSSPPSSHPSPVSSYSMTNRFKSSAASAVGSGLSSLRRKQNSSSPPLPPATVPAVPPAVPPASLIGASPAVARGSETSHQAAPDTMDVAWQCKPSVTGKMKVFN